MPAPEPLITRSLSPRRRRDRLIAAGSQLGSTVTIGGSSPGYAVGRRFARCVSKCSVPFTRSTFAALWGRGPLMGGRGVSATTGDAVRPLTRRARLGDPGPVLLVADHGRFGPGKLADRSDQTFPVTDGEWNGR